MLYKCFFGFLFVLFSLSETFAQNSDSLKLALKNAIHDTTRCNILNALIEAENDKNIWQIYNNQLLKLTEKKLVNANPNILRVTYLKYYATALNNLGVLADQKGDIPKAIEYYNKSLKIGEKLQDKRAIAHSLINLGFVYQNQGHTSKALECYRKSLKILEEIQDKKGIAHSLNNIGVSYEHQGNIKIALEYYYKSLKIQEEIQEEIQDKKEMSCSFNNIGGIYYVQGDFEKALEYYQKSLKIQEEVEDQEGITNSLDRIAWLNLKKGELNEAVNNGKRSLQIAINLRFPESIKNSARTLKFIYKKQNKFKEAFEMYALEMKMRDSINNQETQKATIKNQIQYTYDKKEAANKAEQDKKDAITLQEKKQQKIITYSVTTGALLVVVFVLFIYRGKKQKQKVELENSKVRAKNDILELQQKLLLTQMNPHFIFNSLKSIQNFVLENNTQLASDYISEFGQLMRLILEATRKEYITLEDEIKILEFYLKLERARSGNQFSYEFHIEEYLEDKLDEMLIPSMLLQPIIENAVKHGVKNMEKDGKIDISLTQQNNKLVKIDVLDNGNGLDNPNYKSDGLSISSKIIEERISNFNKTHNTPITYQIEDMKIYNLNGTKVSLTIPMLEDAA